MEQEKMFTLTELIIITPDGKRVLPRGQSGVPICRGTRITMSKAIELGLVKAPAAAVPPAAPAARKMGRKPANKMRTPGEDK